MYKRCLFILFTFLSFNAFTQIVTSTGSSQIEMSKELSPVQLEKNAQQLAIINAIEQAFGRVVIQGNSTYISNFQSGDKVESSSAFNMIGNTYVKGECLEVLKTEYEEIEGRKIIEGKKINYSELKCTVKIKAREIKTPPIEFIAKTLNQENKNQATTSFKNEEALYLYFNTPVNGYLNVFLDDTKNTYRLYPYNDMPSGFQGGVAVNADMDYILFSDNIAYNYYNKSYYVKNKYIMVTDKVQEKNRLFIVFSKEALNKPHFQKKLDEEVLSDEELEKNLQIPDGLSSEDFQRWLQKNRYIRDDVQLTIIDIDIHK